MLAEPALPPDSVLAGQDPVRTNPAFVMATSSRCQTSGSPCPNRTSRPHQSGRHESPRRTRCRSTYRKVPRSMFPSSLRFVRLTMISSAFSCSPASCVVMVSSGCVVASARFSQMKNKSEISEYRDHQIIRRVRHCGRDRVRPERKRHGRASANKGRPTAYTGPLAAEYS